MNLRSSTEWKSLSIAILSHHHCALREVEGARECDSMSLGDLVLQSAETDEGMEVHFVGNI